MVYLISFHKPMGSEREISLPSQDRLSSKINYILIIVGDKNTAWIGFSKEMESLMHSCSLLQSLLLLPAPGNYIHSPAFV